MTPARRKSHTPPGVGWRGADGDRRPETAARTIRRAALFAAVEAAVTLCVEHQDSEPDRPPLVFRLAVISMIVLWSYEAHNRFAFRGVRPREGWLPAAIRFSALSWSCLYVQALVGPPREGAGLASWIVMLGLRFALVRAWIWSPS